MRKITLEKIWKMPYKRRGVGGKATVDMRKTRDNKTGKEATKSYKRHFRI